MKPFHKKLTLFFFVTVLCLSLALYLFHNKATDESQINCLNEAKTQDAIQSCQKIIALHPAWFRHNWIYLGFSSADLAAMGYEPVLVRNEPLTKELQAISFWKNKEGIVAICRSIFLPSGPNLTLPNEECFFSTPKESRLVTKEPEQGK